MKINKSKNFPKLLFIFITAVAVYSIITYHFTIPVHLGVDEELYISMARSFHYDGVFAKDGEILNYSCVLYPVLLSISYFFYSPEHIMFALRMIGVLSMCSSLFPIYFLSRELLEDSKKALKVTIFSCLLPAMMDTAYCMQEVLSYPLFLWICYLIYLEIKKEHLCSISIESVLICILSILSCYTKTYMIFLPIPYCLLIIYDAISQKKWGIIRKLLLFFSGWFLLYLAGGKLILFINDGIEGVNHYANQFSSLFPITWQTVIAAISCSLFYLSALLFYWGVLPVLLPIINRKKYESHDQKFLLFIITALFILIAEIVISIVLTEEKNILFPWKVYYRYFQILEIPIILLFLKKLEAHKLSKWLLPVYTAILSHLCVYYLNVGSRLRNSIIDAPIYLLMENIDRYIIPHFNIIACICSGLVVAATYLLKNKGKIKNVVNLFYRFSIVFMIIFFFINVLQLLYFTNINANGNAIEQDAIAIANYYEKNKEFIENVYYMASKDNRYETAVCVYFPVTVHHIKEISDITAEEKALLISKKGERNSENWNSLDVSLHIFQAFITK